LTVKALAREVRADPNQTGNGSVDAFRSIENQFIFLRCVADRSIRCVRLEAPIAVANSRAV